MNATETGFGPYRLDELLGRGGMGEVYRAYDEEHRRHVALKILAEHLAEDEEFQERFRREAFSAAQLRSPHIIPIHRYGEIDGRLYIDMRLVEGGDLAQLIASQGALSPERAVHMLSQIASALDDAHGHNLVHRDVKPPNVLLDASVPDFCYLTDFGVTRLASGTQSHTLTRTGAIIGSLAYMAPEQFDGAVTTRSDVYALTCVFFEMLTGRKPYQGEGLPALMHAHMSVAPPLPSAVTPEAGLFDDVVAAGMAKDAAARYPSAGELARAARAALDAGRATSGSTAALPVAAVPAPTVADGPAADPDETVAAEADPDATELVEATEEDTAVGDDAVTELVAASDREEPDAAAAAVPAAAPAVPDPDPTPGPGPGPGPATVEADDPRSAPSRPWLRVGLLVAAVTALIVGIAAVSNAVVSGRTAGTTDTAGTVAAAPPAAAPSADPGAAPSAATVPSPAPGVLAANGVPVTEALYTGRTSDGRITVAVGFKDGKAAAYICDGDEVEVWMEGAISGVDITLNGREGSGASMIAAAKESSVQGDVTVGGRTLPFSANNVINADGSNPEGAGLYQNVRQVNGVATRIGWIVLPDGDQVGIRSQGATKSPAPPLDPAARTASDGGETVTAVPVTGDTTVILGR